MFNSNTEIKKAINTSLDLKICEGYLSKEHVRKSIRRKSWGCLVVETKLEGYHQQKLHASGEAITGFVLSLRQSEMEAFLFVLFTKGEAQHKHFHQLSQEHT